MADLKSEYYIHDFIHCRLECIFLNLIFVTLSEEER